MYNSDGEMEQLAEDLKATLELCDDSPHFVVSISRQTATRGFSGIQVVFKGSLPDKDRSLAEAVVSTLKREGLQIDGPPLEPPRGTVTRGGGNFARIAGINENADFEIAIGKKP